MAGLRRRWLGNRDDGCFPPSALRGTAVPLPPAPSAPRQKGSPNEKVRGKKDAEWEHPMPGVRGALHEFPQHQPGRFHLRIPSAGRLHDHEAGIGSSAMDPREGETSAPDVRGHELVAPRVIVAHGMRVAEPPSPSQKDRDEEPEPKYGRTEEMTEHGGRRYLLHGATGRVLFLPAEE
jgi:hypothetical protein